MCSYCLRPRHETGPLVHSPLAAICRSCAEHAVELFGRTDADRDTEWDSSQPAFGRTDDETLLRRLGEITGAGAQVEEHLQAWVDEARTRGISWARIGAAMGMTRQSAWERFATHRPMPEP